VSQPFTDLWNKITDTGPRWLVALAIVVVTYLVARLVGKLVQKAVGRTSTQGHIDILIGRGVSAVILMLGVVLARAGGHEPLCRADDRSLGHRLRAYSNLLPASRWYSTVHHRPWRETGGTVENVRVTPRSSPTTGSACSYPTGRFAI
jgi:hypothetical protein